ncbi:MAG: diphthine--ammonia ligase [bacterium]
MFVNWKNNVRGARFVCSWSGGKDSCLALYRASRLGQPVMLFTMLEETGRRSRSHGLPLPLLRSQADALGLPVETRSAAWENYETEFIGALCQFKQEGIQAAVFGDIDLEEHGVWEEKVCGAAGLRLCLPLWENDRGELVAEFINLGFKAVIAAVKESVLSSEYLGRELSMELLDELKERGFDLCGENGEYHTAVLDGPIFKRPVRAAWGDVQSHGNYSFLLWRG